MAGPLGRLCLIAAPLLLIALMAAVWPRQQASPAASSAVPRPALPTSLAPAEPWQVTAGDGQGAQAGAVFRIPADCPAQRLSYTAELSEPGQSDVWIGFAVVNSDGRAVEMTPSRDVLAYPRDDFDLDLSPGSYRVRVQARGAEWSYAVECLPE